MKLAFRKTISEGFWAGIFNRYTAWKLKTAYFHGGILIGDILWHTTKTGFKPTVFHSPESWDLFETPVSDKIALERISGYLGTRYDAFGLLGFQIPFRFTDSKALYCFEAQWLALTGENPSKPISPDTVMSELLRMINAQSMEVNGAAVIHDVGDGSVRDPHGFES